MSDTDFDTALVTAAFRLAGDQGWRNINVVAATREAGLSLVQARERFPSRAAILLRFGRIADQAALVDAATEGTENQNVGFIRCRNCEGAKRAFWGTGHRQAPALQHTNMSCTLRSKPRSKA